jgi:hypothetical protein
MTTELIGQSQTVAGSNASNQGDGAIESPNSQRIRERAYVACGRAIHGTRLLEGALLEVLNAERLAPIAADDLELLSDADLDRAMVVALNVFDALSEPELEAVARKHGL